ncbi:hypothetical protein OF83DRAFT_1082003 [Amylostereum chailletii]|nr:hypothetical protein OF83DRAFT_1082003 [Amylostereum chailletii]
MSDVGESLPLLNPNTSMHGGSSLTEPTTPSQVVFLAFPTEILLRVIIYCVADDPFDAPGTSASTAFVIGQICRRLRDIALDYPAMWTHLGFQTPTLTNVMLKRSKHAPISIRFDSVFRPRASLRAARRAIAELSRTNTLRLNIQRNPGSKIEAFMADIMLTPKEQLQDLELTSPDKSHDPKQSAVFRFHPAFWDTVMPLRRLKLESVVPVPTSFSASKILLPHCARLTHLELNCMPTFFTNDVLRLLSAARSTLEVVVFDLSPLRHGIATSAPALAPEQPIVLSNLDRMQITSTSTATEPNMPANILQHVVFPPTAKININLSLTSADHFQKTICTYVPINDSRHPPPPYQTALIYYTTPEPFHSSTFHLSAWSLPSSWTRRGAPDFFDRDSAPDAELQVRISLAPQYVLDDTWFVGALADIIRMARLDPVYGATIARLPVEAAKEWTRLLRTLPNVRELCIHGTRAIEGACGALSNAGHAVLPRLETLAVYEAALRDDTASGRTSAFDALYTTLGERAAALKEACLCYSDVGISDVDALAGQVRGRELVWDGSRKGRSSVPEPEPEPAWTFERVKEEARLRHQQLYQTILAQASHQMQTALHLSLPQQNGHPFTAALGDGATQADGPTVGLAAFAGLFHPLGGQHVNAGTIGGHL